MSLDPGFSTASGRRIFGAANRLRRMLDVEAALARANAEAGLISSAAGDAVAAGCDAEDFDAEAIFAQGWEAGSPVIPLVTELKARVGEPHAAHVHFGATTQDVVDTGLMLQAREGLEALEGDLRPLGRALAGLAAEHRRTPQVARTLMQPAEPITFGLTAASWLDPLTRDLERLVRVRGRLALQLGGPAGDLAAWGEKGPAVAAAMARRLGLEAPALPWHTARDRVGEVAAALCLHCRTVAKIAQDLVLLAQAEVGEVSMRGGGSSAMPGKKNPIDAVRAAAASRFAAGQAAILLGVHPHEHQRATGAWHLEWAAMPSLFLGALAATEALGRAVGTLEVHAERMADHLERLPSGRGRRPGTHADLWIDRALQAWSEAGGGGVAD